jgi:amino acid transporter
VLMLVEVAILLIFDVAVVGSGGTDGLSLAPFDPTNVFDGAYGVAFLFAFASFVGFEATAIYGEEARDPKRTIPRATYAAVALIGLFYVAATYAITMAVGSGRVAAEAAENPGTFIFAANTEFVGSWSTHAMNVLTVTSLFAVVLAFHNTLARYLYSLGRGGVLPPFLGRTHGAYRSPHTASVVQSAGALVVLVVFMLAGADPFAEIYAWLVGVGTVGVLVLQATVAVVVVVFFRRTGLDRRIWHTIVAPLLGAAGLICAIVMAVQNWDVLTGATSGIVAHLYWLIPIAAVAGAVLGVWRTREGADLERGFSDEPAAGAEAPPPATPVAS